LRFRHQLAVLHRQRPGRPQLFALDRLLWIWLYRVWPQCLNVMVLVKPATVVRWHRHGFRLYWRWRSRSGWLSVDREVRDLIRHVNSANPLWGAPRIHGELLKLGIRISQATVAKYMVRRKAFADLAQLSSQRSNRHRHHRYIRRCVSLVSTDYVMIILQQFRLSLWTIHDA
jgi:hypothetical protein